MFSHDVRGISFALLVAGLAMLSAGCRTTGSERAKRTTSSMRELRAELERVVRQIDLTTGALSGLATDRSAGAQGRFNQIVEGIERLGSQTERLEKLAATMTSRSNAYLKAWDKKHESIENEELRKLSQERYAGAKIHFENLGGVVREATQACKPYLARLRDVQRFLDVNLNPSGIAAVAELIKKIGADSEPVKASIRKAVAELDSVIAAWSPPEVEKKEGEEKTQATEEAGAAKAETPAK